MNREGREKKWEVEKMEGKERGRKCYREKYRLKKE